VHPVGFNHGLTVARAVVADSTLQWNYLSCVSTVVQIHRAARKNSSLDAKNLPLSLV
jgi:hypothetical protein